MPRASPAAGVPEPKRPPKKKARAIFERVKAVLHQCLREGIAWGKYQISLSSLGAIFDA